MLAHRGGVSCAVARPVQRVRAVAVRASGSAVQTLSVPVKSASSGAAAGTAELSLKVAGEDTAKGLVHRYLVYILQNARRVSWRLDWVVVARARSERWGPPPEPPPSVVEGRPSPSPIAPARPRGPARCGARRHWQSSVVLGASRGLSGLAAAPLRARARRARRGRRRLLFLPPLSSSSSPHRSPVAAPTPPPPAIPISRRPQQRANSTTQGTASTLTRGEVRGGGKKPYKQKGTGGARRGSSTSPLFPGGGVTFGPKPKDWSIKMNKKERRLALATALASAAGDMTVVDSLAEVAADGKTKALVAALAGMGCCPMEKKVLLIAAEAHEHVMRAGGNVERLAINTADAVQAFDVLNSEAIVIEKAALEKIAAALGGGDA